MQKILFFTLTILKNFNDHISETHYPIHFMYAHRPYFALWLYSDCWRIW